MILLHKTTLRRLIPVLIFIIIFSISLLKFGVNIYQIDRQVERSSIEQLQSHLIRYTSILQHLIYSGDRQAAFRSFRLLDADTSLIFSSLLDENNNILARVDKGSPQYVISPGQYQLFGTIRRTQKGSVIRVPETDFIDAVFPVFLESEENFGQFTKNGIICFRYNLAIMKSGTLHQAFIGLSIDLIMMLLLALTIWWIIDTLITRRVKKLVQVSRSWASGELSQRIDSTGQDEISVIGQAMNDMAASLSADRKRLKESERKYIKLSENLERIILKRTKALETSNIKLTAEISRASAAELELRKFSRAVEQSPVAIIMTDTKGIIEYVNPKFCEITGYEPQEVLGNTPRLLKSGEMSNIVYEQLWSTISAGYIWRNELQNRKKNNDIYWINASIAPVKNEAGVVTNYIAIQEDITASKQSGETIKMLAQAIQSVSEIVYITDLERRIIFVNDAFLKAHGYLQEEVIGQSISIIHPHDKTPQMTEKLENATIRGGWQGEVVTRRKDKTEFPILLSTSAILDEAGRTMALIGVAMDISKQKEAEEFSKKSEMLKTVRELAGAVSHEFAQPLQALSNYLGLLKNHPHNQEYINKSEEMVKRIAMLVTNLREITSIQKQDYLNTQIIDIKASAREYVPNKKPLILVVDDEQSIRETMVEILQTAGYSCEGANDGFEALQMLHRTAYHLILSDINMPKMNGGTLYNKARSIGYKGYFLFMTGYAVSDELEDIIKDGDGFINKPVDYQSLIQIVTQFLGPPQTEPDSY